MSNTGNIIYLDNNATTALKPAIRDIMLSAMMVSPHNASSVHKKGREARKLVEDARKKVARLVNAGEDTNVIFTSCGTESNNLAVKGVKGYKPVVSAVEHFSVLKSVHGGHIVPVDNNGIVDLKALEKILRTIGGKALVSVMLANNETGVIQPVKEIVELVHAHGGLVHTDAIQAVGKIEVDMQALGVDLISIAPHKFGGPKGTGALIAKKNVPLTAIQNGGGQELGFRAGTENIVAIAGFGMAAEQIIENLAAAKRLQDLRDYMEKEIKNISEEVEVFGEKVARLPNTSCLTMPGVKAETQLIDFDLAGVAVSSGSACSSGKVTVSHVLEAMGVEKENAETAIRVSLGIETTQEEIEEFIKIWRELFKRAARNRKAA